LPDKVFGQKGRWRILLSDEKAGRLVLLSVILSNAKELKAYKDMDGFFTSFRMIFLNYFYYLRTIKIKEL